MITCPAFQCVLSSVSVLHDITQLVKTVELTKQVEQTVKTGHWVLIWMMQVIIHCVLIMTNLHMHYVYIHLLDCEPNNSSHIMISIKFYEIFVSSSFDDVLYEFLFPILRIVSALILNVIPIHMYGWGSCVDSDLRLGEEGQVCLHVYQVLNLKIHCYFLHSVNAMLFCDAGQIHYRLHLSSSAITSWVLHSVNSAEFLF